jgi:uncharacterized protein
MQFNVAQLLLEPVGATRKHAVAEWPVERGRVRLTRVLGGVMVEARLTVYIEEECSRCLAQFGTRLPVEFTDVFYQRADPRTGERIEVPEDEPDPFFIGADHIIDITEALRQYRELAVALQPLCRPDCPGLCQECGTDLASGRCECSPDLIDPRLAILTAFVNREESA